MKRKVLTACAFLVVLAAVLVYRAETVFEDRQVEPAAIEPRITFDEAGAVRRLARAVTFPTVSHDDRSRFDARAFLEFRGFLEESFPLVHERLEREVVNGYSLVYHLRGADPSLQPVLFMGHMDVVPVDPATRSDWRYDPFGGTVADGAIWGRGTQDDKIGVLALLEAMETLLAENPQPRRSVYLAFGHDEEVGGQDGAARIAARFAELGTRFRFVLDEGGAVTEGMVGGIERPVAVIGVAEKGWANLELVVDAPGGHSSQPPDHTAVGILSAAIVRIESRPFPPDIRYTKMTTDFVGPYLPFARRLLMGNAWLFSRTIERIILRQPADAAGIRTTIAATMISGSPKSNILPTRASAIVNFRILPGETVESVRSRVERIIDDERVKISVASGWDPSPVSPASSEEFALLAGTIRALDPDILVAPYLVRGGTDAKYYHALSDNIHRFLMVRVSPETIRQVHGIDEHVAVADYLAAIRFYHRMIEQSL
jgi:carboxypeptidase PM20D1